MRLAAVDPSAQALGLEVGMTLADARGRCPDLASAPHDPAADARALAGVIAACARFTPAVAPDPPDGIVLDITGCAHLFGGEAAMRRTVIALVVQHGFTARAALADNAAAARALARHGRAGTTGDADDIAELPIAALGLAADGAVALRRAGLTRLGELAARPLAAIAARFGATVVLRLRQILGEADSPIAPTPPRPRLHRTARFAEPIARTDDVLEVIETLLDEAAAILAQAGQGGRWFQAVLHRSDGARAALAVETGLPCRDPRVVLRLFAERIDSLSDPLDPGFGFDAITLTVARRQALAVRQIALEGATTGMSRPEGGGPGDDLYGLLDRLAVRLSRDALCVLHPGDTHIPEAAQVLAPIATKGMSGWESDRDPAAPIPYPAQPKPVEGGTRQDGGRGFDELGLSGKWRASGSRLNPNANVFIVGREMRRPGIDASIEECSSPRLCDSRLALVASPDPPRPRDPAFHASGGSPARPLYLFDPPQPVRAIAEVPDGPPKRFRWRGQLHVVLLAEGPERIAAEWWRRREGHRQDVPAERRGLTRDYYRIEDSAGRRYWIFRHGAFAETPDPGWYIHGLFA